MNVLVEERAQLASIEAARAPRQLRLPARISAFARRYVYSA